jgi:hypothetical protein
MVCAMFVGDEKDEHYSDDEIRELVVWNGNGASAVLSLMQLAFPTLMGRSDQPGVTYPMTTSSQLRSASRVR